MPSHTMRMGLQSSNRVSPSIGLLKNVESLARVELSVVQEGYGAIGLVRTMADKFKERTFESIKSQQQKADYKAILAELQEEASQARDVAERSDADVGSARTAGSDTDNEWSEDLEAWFGVMNHPSDFVRDFCRAVVSSDLALYHGTFERWITSLAEPRARAKRPWKPAPVAGRSRKVKRQEAYRSLQALWSSRRSRACNSALDASWSDTGVSHHSNDELATFWRGVFEAEDSGEPRPGPAEPTLSELIKPITMPELVRVIGKMSVSAPGPDRVSLKRLRSEDRSVLAAALNSVLYFGEAPASFLSSRTTLIPKSKIPASAGDYRPISVTSIVCRLYHKLLSRRVELALRLHHSQRAFRAVDGVAANLTVLDCVISDSKTNRRDVNIGFVDLRKAFDSVSHASLLAELGNVGFPPILLRYLKHYYAHGTTSIGRHSMGIRRGVRQGDPLSPVLFNTLVDRALSDSRRVDAGYVLNGEVIRSLAFADDVVLIASTKRGLEDSCKAFLDRMRAFGPIANPAKCATLATVTDGKRKTFYVDPTPFLTVAGAVVPALNVHETYRYLGVMVGATASAERHTLGAELDGLLGNLKQAPLKPAQKVYTVIHHVCPRLMHRLVLGKFSREKLHRIDRKIRKFLRELLNFPKDTPLAYFYAEADSGGIGIPCFTTLVPRLALSRFESLAKLEEPDVAAAVQSSAFEGKLDGIRRKVCEQVLTKPAERRYWEEELYRRLDGASLRSYPSAPGAQAWVNDGSQLRGRRYIGALQVRGNLCHTPVRLSRGRPGAVIDKFCKKVNCTGGLNCLSHVIQSCGSTHRLRVKRHDRVADLVSEELEGRGYKVTREPRIAFEGTCRKPDIVATKGDVSHCIDVHVCGDARGMTMGNLSVPYEEKVTKYSKPEIIRGIKAVTGASLVEFAAVIVSWRGVVCERSMAYLRGLGAGKRLAKVLSVVVCEASYGCRVAYSHTA